MSDCEKDFIVASVDEVMYIPGEGTAIRGSVWSSGFSDEEVKERMSELAGEDSTIEFGTREEIARRTGSVAFSSNRWRSSWDPKAAENAQYN